MWHPCKVTFLSNRKHLGYILSFLSNGGVEKQRVTVYFRDYPPFEIIRLRCQSPDRVTLGTPPRARTQSDDISLNINEWLGLIELDMMKQNNSEFPITI